MATVFNGTALTITLSAPTNGTLELNVERLYSEWKEWMLADPQNMGYPPAFRTVGGDPLTSGIDAGAYFFLDNSKGWRIQSSDADQTVYVEGNLVPESSTLPLVIPTPGRTVMYDGLQPITQSVDEILNQTKSAQYRGIVHIDVVNGTAGTAFPIGLDSDPVNNITDAKQILADVGGNTIHFEGDLTLDQDVEGYNIVGASAVLSNTLTLAGYSVDNSMIGSCYITGNQGGTIAGFEGYKCGLTAVTNLAAALDVCAFFDTVTLKLNSTNIWARCFSAVAGNTKPVVTGNGCDELHVRAWTGGLDLQTVSNAEFACSIDCVSGRVKLSSTVSAGDIVIGGVTTLDDQSTGTAIVAQSQMSPEAQKRMTKALAWRHFTNGTTGNLEIYDDAGTKDQDVPIYNDDGVTAWDGTSPILRRDKIV